MTSRKNPAGQPAGWYPDLAGQAMLRWRDGSRWGEQTQAAPSGALQHPAAPQTQPGYGIAPPPPDPGVARRRTALGVVLVTIVLIAAGLAVALRAGPSPQPASPLVVQGHVTGTDGTPVTGIKVWLNALHDSHQTGAVTVVGSVTTSAIGSYALRVVPSAALAADATNGVIKFTLMTGDSAGWDTFNFSRRLTQTSAGTTVGVSTGGTVTADLRLIPH
jgi:hypothetical protein